MKHTVKIIGENSTRDAIDVEAVQIAYNDKQVFTVSILDDGGVVVTANGKNIRIEPVHSHKVHIRQDW